MSNAKSAGDSAFASSAFRRIEALARAAENPNAADPRLIEGARQWLRARSKAVGLFPKDLLRDAPWAMLLELFLNHEEGGICHVKQLMITSGESPASAMRLLDRLEVVGLIERTPDTQDKRRVMVRLTHAGRDAMIAALTHMFIETPTAAATSAPVAYKRPQAR